MKIAVFVGGIIYDSQKSLIKGINDYASSHGVNVFIFTCGGEIYSVSDHNRGEFQIYSLPDISVYDGIIVAPDTIQNEQVVETLAKRIRNAGVPSISIDSSVDGAGCFYVDNESAMYSMTEHVIKEHNRHNLLYISGPHENKESDARTCGFMDCISTYGKSNGIHYSIEYGDFWTDSGSRIMEKYIDNGLPDAVICANDFMASGAIKTLLENNIRIPEDVIVTGFDNSYEAKYSVVRISSVEKPMYRIGYDACSRLCLRTEAAITNKSFPVKYYFSESCGCGEEHDHDDRTVKQQLSNEKYSNRRMAEMINLMSADLNEVNSVEAFTDKLKTYILKMLFPFFYLCLCVETEDDIVCRNGKYQFDVNGKSDYSDKINVVIAYEKGVYLPSTVISREKIVPDSYYQHENIMSVIVPIHFRLHCIGYCIVGNSNLPFDTLQFQSWIMNLGNSLENIHKQSIMKQMIEHLDRMWTYDTMTGTLNRAGFTNRAEEVIHYCRENSKDILLLFVDADRLKYVNDTYGHDEGDFYIKTVANSCILNCPDKGIVMRYGGDEFVILAPNIDEEYHMNSANLINKLITQVHDENLKPFPMSASVGAYISKVNLDFSLEHLINQADKEMYKIKHTR